MGSDFAAVVVISITIASVKMLVRSIGSPTSVVGLWIVVFASLHLPSRRVASHACTPF